MALEIYHVRMRPDGQWVGQRENAERASIISSDKEAVVQQIREIVATHKARMFVYDRDGQLQPERTYPRRLRRSDQPVNGQATEPASA